MIREDDVKWWVLEAKKHPESTPAIIEELAKRLLELDAENERLRDDLVRLQHHAPATTESAEVSALQQKVATLQTILDSQVSAEPTLVFLSGGLQAARLPIAQAERLAREERPALNRQAMLGLRCLLLARPQDELLAFTSTGRGLKLLPADIPLLGEEGDWPPGTGAQPASGERLAAAIPVSVAQPPRFWTIVTRRGYVRQILRIELDLKVGKGEPLIESPLRNDAPVAVVDGDRGDLLVLTRWGKGARFAQRAIEPTGSVALELEPDDEVVAALALPADMEILLVTAGGFAARRETAQFRAQSKPGGTGKPLMQAYDVMDAFPCETPARLSYLTYSGRLVFASTADVPLYQRSEKGTRLRTFDRDPAVAVVLVS
jgi:DNA gyrase/topoisomerase IV subunit A